MTVKFYGQTYDRETLAVTRELSLANAKVIGFYVFIFGMTSELDLLFQVM